MKFCPGCGTANPDDAIYCSECAHRFESVPPPAQPQYVPPPAQPPYPPPGYPPLGYQYYRPPYPRFAGFWIRVAASLIDGFVITLALLPLNVIFTALDNRIPIFFFFWGLWIWTEGAGVGLLIAFNVIRLAVIAVYLTAMTGRYGATVGKMFLKLKVVRVDLSRVSYGRAALREIVGKLLSFIPCCLGFIWVSFDPRKQGWMDKIADTLVIYE